MSNQQLGNFYPFEVGQYILVSWKEQPSIRCIVKMIYVNTLNPMNCYAYFQAVNSQIVIEQHGPLTDDIKVIVEKKGVFRS